MGHPSLTPDAAEPREPRMTFETNHNGKLHSKCFVHVTTMPKNGTLNGIVGKEFEAVVLDKTVPPFRIKLIDVNKYILDSVPGVFTFTSHGMNLYEFVEWYCKRAGIDIEKADREVVAVYYWKILNYHQP